jgi:hypothetical protein
VTDLGYPGRDQMERTEARRADCLHYWMYFSRKLALDEEALVEALRESDAILRWSQRLRIVEEHPEDIPAWVRAIREHRFAHRGRVAACDNDAMQVYHQGKWHFTLTCDLERWAWLNGRENERARSFVRSRYHCRVEDRRYRVAPAPYQPRIADSGVQAGRDAGVRWSFEFHAYVSWRGRWRPERPNPRRNPLAPRRRRRGGNRLRPAVVR